MASLLASRSCTTRVVRPSHVRAVQPHVATPKVMRAQRVILFAAAEKPAEAAAPAAAAAAPAAAAAAPAPPAAAPAPPAAAPAPAAAAPAAEGTPTAESVLAGVQSIIAAQLGSSAEDKVKADATFVDLGADSLDTVEIMMALEEHFGIELDEEGAEKISTVGQAAELIHAQILKK